MSFQKQTDVKSIQTGAAVVGAVMIVLSLVLAWYGWGYRLPKDPGEQLALRKLLQIIVVVLWILVPPIYFWFEYFFMHKGLSDKEDSAAFKYGQELSAKIWLAVSSVLFILYFAKDLK